MKSLVELTQKEYQGLYEVGMLWEIYPDASGSWQKDCNEPWEEIGQLKLGDLTTNYFGFREKMYDRVDQIIKIMDDAGLEFESTWHSTNIDSITENNVCVVIYFYWQDPYEDSFEVNSVMVLPKILFNRGSEEEIVDHFKKIQQEEDKKLEEAFIHNFLADLQKVKEILPNSWLADVIYNPDDYSLYNNRLEEIGRLKGGMYD